MPKGKILLPQDLRMIARSAFEGKSQKAVAREMHISESTISRFIGKLRKENIFSLNELEAITDADLLKIIYPSAIMISNGEKSCFVKVLRSDHAQILRPDFKAEAVKIIDQKKDVLTLYVDYLDECIRTNMHHYTRSAFYRHVKSALAELQRGSNAIMSFDRKYGEACMLDAAGTTVNLTMEDGSSVKMIILAICWAASGFVYATFIEHMSTIEVCRAIGRALKLFGCKPQVLVIDNAKCMVVKHEKGKEAIFNPTFEEYVRQYGIDIEANNPYSPTEKSQIEYSIRLITERVLPLLNCSVPRTKSEWDRHLQELVDKYINNVSFKGGSKSRTDRFFEYEKEAASPLLETIYEVPTVFDAKVSRNYHVRVGTHAYSVPYDHIGLTVRIKFTDLSVKIYYEGDLIAEHQREFSSGRTTKPEHMPPHHRAYQESKRRFKTDADLLRYARTISEPVLNYCTWRLQKQDGQRFKACTGVIHFVLQTDPAVANEALRLVMMERPERRSYYTLKKYYTELMGYKNSHDSPFPRQTELNFSQPQRESYPWDQEGDEAFISYGTWFDKDKEGDDDDDDKDQKAQGNDDGKQQSSDKPFSGAKGGSQ